MNTEATKLWNVLTSSWQRDQVLSLLRLGLEADNERDMALDLEAWSELHELSALPTAIDRVTEQFPLALLISHHSSTQIRTAASKRAVGSRLKGVLPKWILANNSRTQRVADLIKQWSHD